jgi:hypothetical protein
VLLDLERVCGSVYHTVRRDRSDPNKLSAVQASGQEEVEAQPDPDAVHSCHCLIQYEQPFPAPHPSVDHLHVV